MLRIRGNQLSLLAALSAHWAHQQLAIPRVHRLASKPNRGPAPLR
ncbi:MULTISPECIES: hypothetical protein [unclassified Cyanobium]|nr:MULTISPECIES: hypothetical protein [unclassified Cyanobium]QNI70133.1 hypothetical protein CyaNS01_00996 [Cyanobium sp. NS01]